MRVVGSKRCSLDGLAMSVILEAINLAGEPRKLAEYSKAYLAPQLMEVACSVILSNEDKDSENEIVTFLGLARPAVRNILRATLRK